MKLEKVTIRLYAEDCDAIRSAFPGGHGPGSLGLNRVIREIVHSWVQEKLTPILEETSDTPDLQLRLFDDE